MTRNPIRWVRQTSGIPWRKRIRHHINVVRWTLDRCDGCGHRFAWKGDARFGLNSQTFHESCLGWKTWRNTADERMQVLELVCDVWDVRPDDVRELMANRAESEGYERSNAWNLAVARVLPHGAAPEGPRHIARWRTRAGVEPVSGLRFCRECSEGKHPNCDGTAWDNEADAPTSCTCPDRIHQ